MSQTSENILNAVNYLIDSKISKLQLDKTIIAEINSIVDISIGEYKVKYESNIFSAFSEDLSKEYKIGDSVYVKIPQSDFNKKKLIEGKTSSKSSDTYNSNYIVNNIGPNIFNQYYDITEKPWGICAGLNDDNFIIYDDINTNESADTLLSLYAQNAQKLKISADFTTNLLAYHNQGEYFLEFNFWNGQYNEEGQIDKTSLISFNLDFSSFIGDPYHYNVPTTQSIIIDLSGANILGLASIVLKQKNFSQDYFILYENGTEIKNYINKNNIFVENIILQFVEVIDLSEISYFLTIQSKQGTYFTEQGINEIELTGKLMNYGTDITNDERTKFIWFKEDYSVFIGDENYNVNAGARWREIASGKVLNITRDEVPVRQKYKLVSLYNEIVLTKEIEAINPDSQYINTHLIQLTSSNGNNISVKISDDNLIGMWYYSTGDNQRTLSDNPSNSIDLPQDILTYKQLTIYCAIANPALNLFLTIDNSEEEEDVLVDFVGQDVFQYDANGDIDYESAFDTTRWIRPVIQWAQGKLTSYKITWLLNDIEITNQGLNNPNNSMFNQLYVDKSSNILYYNIKQKYNINYTNNILTLRITAINGTVYEYYKEIVFLKDGDQGTNGTSFCCVIRPCNENGEEFGYIRPYCNDDINYCLKAKVYKDGDLIDLSDKNYSIEFIWTKHDLNTELIANNIQKITDIINIDSAYVTVQVNIQDKLKKTKTSIYYHYPIDTYNGNVAEIDQLIDTNIPLYIKYNAAGINPSYATIPIYFKINDVNQEISEKIDNELISITGNVTDGFKIQPTINASDTQTFVATLQCGSKYTHPMIIYLNTFGNEAINGWDGTSIEKNDEEGYILAPQIGAGSKDSNNRFSGVVMGRDTALNLIGLFGYEKGINTFQLREDGIAIIGAKGKGQITINGESGTIQSGNYIPSNYNGTGAGMRIDLVEGAIDAANFKLTANNLYLDSDRGTYIFKDNSGTELLYISNNTYYLQSSNYAKNQNEGSYFDLENGKIICNNLIARKSGSIGYFQIDNDTLIHRNNKLKIDEDGIVTNYLRIKDNINGSEIGIIGYGPSANNQYNNIFNISSRNNNIRIDTGGTLTLRGGTAINVYGSSISFLNELANPRNQYGIYARFA